MARMTALTSASRRTTRSTRHAPRYDEFERKEARLRPDQVADLCLGAAARRANPV